MEELQKKGSHKIEGNLDVNGNVLFEKQFKSSGKHSGTASETANCLKNNCGTIIRFPEVWMNQLLVNSTGQIKSTIQNFILILENDEHLKNKLRLNEHSKRVEIKDENGSHGLLNLDLSNIKNIIEKKYGIYNKEKIADALELVASKDSYHPIKEYIESLKWDGIKRIDTAFSDYFGADEIPYNAMCMRLILLGAIERVYEPGCKFDPMVIMRGAQGLGKSTFFRYICGEDKYYQGNFKNVDKAFEYTNGKWICEMAELSILKKTDAREEIKSYLTQVSDTHTLKYKPYPEDYPRQFIIIGTTNETIFLNDDTGERRFPIVECAIRKSKFKKSVFDSNGKKEIQQILAEAYNEYKKGIRLYDVPEEFKEEMERIQSGYRAENTEKGIIESYLEDKTEVCLNQLWCEAFGHKISDKFLPSDKNKFVKILSDLPNWKVYDESKDGRKNFDKVFSGFNYQGEPIYKSYGKQKCWIKYKTEEEILKEKEEKEEKEKEKQKITVNNEYVNSYQNKYYTEEQLKFKVGKDEKKWIEKN